MRTAIIVAALGFVLQQDIILASSSSPRGRISIPKSKHLANMPERGGAIGSSSQSRAESTTTIKTTTVTTALSEGLKSTLASGLAAACSKTILAPFDTLKTVQQHVPGSTSLGMLQACQQIISRPGGLRNLYAGLGVSAVGSMPSVGLYFGVYSYCKRILGPALKQHWGSTATIASSGSNSNERDKNDSRYPNNKAVYSDIVLHNLAIGISAAIGNTVASFSRVPYEVVKQSLQTGQYTTTYEAISLMWREGGMRSFFPLGGISIQMLRDIPYAIVTLLSYEYIKEVWVMKRSAQDPKNRWIRDMIAGATAGGIGSYVTNPFDVIKTRLQTTIGKNGLAVSSPYDGSIMACAMDVMKEGGPAAFLRGSVPRLMHKIPANGFFFVFYEFFKRILRVDHS